MRDPIAVLISDVHYNLQTIRLADAAMRMAIQKANELGVPLIVAGDLHDTKANLRGECVNAMIETFKLCDEKPYILVGNHDKINEKSEDHSLNFLSEYANIIDKPVEEKKLGLHLFPYFTDTSELFDKLSYIPSGECVIMHQGLKDSHMGDYIQDKSAITKDDVMGLRVISGHYHARQTINLPSIGKWDYIGNPYTLSWGEATDPEKGFQVLYKYGYLEFVPTKLRRHIIANTTSLLRFPQTFKRDDLVWVKVTDTKENLSSITRGKIAQALGRDVFKLTYHPLGNGLQDNLDVPKTNTKPELLDSLISGLTNTTEECKLRLKELWRSL